jgi:leucyl/phenylalanyl-tRNA--protein transferase
MFPWPSVAVTDNPYHTLWHYAHGRMPDWVNGSDGEVAWIKREHRGVQWLDKIQLPKKSQHLKYILQPKFTIKFDTAFEQVLRACADLKREGKTWIREELFRGYCALHKMGFAHSFEAWDGDKLVAGAFGLQMGALMSIDSVFHHVSNAGMAVYGQTLLRLKDRGFKLIDVNYVSGPFARFGEEWVPQWKFEQLLADMQSQHPTIADDQPAPTLPKRIRLIFPLSSRIEKLTARFRTPYTKAQTAPIAEPSPADTKPPTAATAPAQKDDAPPKQEQAA